MKKSTFYITAIAIILLFSLTASGVFAQTVKSSDKELKDTVIKTISYKLYQGSKGGKYILRTAKSGKSYKQYFKAK